MSRHATAPGATRAALDHLLDRYVEHHRSQTGALPAQTHDPRWPSPCEVGEPEADGTIRWRPRARDTQADFSGLERALETELHPDIKHFYASYWSGSLTLEADEGGLTLIQLWNDDDFDRLIENILGHAMAKQRVDAPLTIFIACTDEGDLILSVDNATGCVVLEEPGSHPIKEVAPSLAEFLDRLRPVTAPDT